MNNRTRTNLHLSNGKILFLELIGGYYKKGTIGIVYDDDKKCREVSEALLKAGYGIKSVELGKLCMNSFEEHIQFFIGVGTREVATPIRFVASHCRYCFYCTDISPLYFGSILHSDSSNSFAEFAYFDTAFISIQDTKIVSKGYSTMVLLLASLLDSYCKDIILPYRNIKLQVLVNEIKDFLFKAVDSDIFFVKMLQTIKNTTDYLTEKNIVPLTYQLESASRQKWSVEKEFLVSYLLFYLGLIFTKWNFNDMLIPAAMQKRENEIKLGVLLNQSDKISLVMLSKEQINHLAMVFRAQGNDFKNNSVIEAISLIIKHCDSKGIIGEINNMGVLERLINYEEYKGY